MTIVFPEFKILTYSNREKYAIAMNSPDNAYNPGAYSRFDWTIDTEGVAYYCQTRYDAASAQEAYETAASDSSDLASGCGNFSWTTLSATTLDLVGSYADSWGTAHAVTLTTWAQTSSWTEDGGMVGDTSEFTFLYHSNEQQWVIAQNSDSNAWNAGLFSRFDWVTVDEQLYFCQTAFDAASAREALELAAADANDPANGGCGFSTWSSITAND